MINAFQSFDRYSLQARLYPAFLTIAPILIITLFFWEQQIPKKLLPLLGGIGFFFFAASFVRSAGKKLEKKLIQSWDGLPTTRHLRHRGDHNKTISQRRKRFLRNLTGIRFPSAAAETADPAKADEVYISATRALIARVRDNQAQYPRVHEENIHYGYRRNTLALKPVALTILGVTLLIDSAILFANFSSVPGIVATGIHIVLLLAWIFVVNAEWVYEAAESYAERLFDTLEDPSLFAPSNPGENQTAQ